jgi:hypothetical protein
LPSKGFEKGNKDSSETFPNRNASTTGSADTGESLGPQDGRIDIVDATSSDRVSPISRKRRSRMESHQLGGKTCDHPTQFAGICTLSGHAIDKEYGSWSLHGE